MGEPERGRTLGIVLPSVQIGAIVRQEAVSRRFGRSQCHRRGVLALVSVVLELLEVLSVRVTVIGGAEPEAWCTCFPVSLVVDDNLAHD